jgi:hypothetical protein
MASMDHTARVRLLVPPEPKSKRLDEELHPLSPEQEQWQTCASKQAGIAVAVAVIEGMLIAHSNFTREHPNGKQGALLPFNPVQRHGLNAALYFLHHYVDTLDSEPSG